MSGTQACLNASSAYSARTTSEFPVKQVVLGDETKKELPYLLGYDSSCISNASEALICTLNRRLCAPISARHSEHLRNPALCGAESLCGLQRITSRCSHSPILIPVLRWSPSQHPYQPLLLPCSRPQRRLSQRLHWYLHRSHQLFLQP